MSNIKHELKFGWARLNMAKENNEIIKIDTLIVGTGFSGTCVAIKMKEAGMNDFIMIDRSSEVGGTWRDNSYPGAACDIPSHLYSFSFAQNPNWSRKYPSQPELFEYTKGVIERYGLMPHIRLNQTVKKAVYQEDTGYWRVSTNVAEYECHQYISCVGALSDAKMPDNIPGIESFKGHSFHSSKWDHDYDLTGKRVAVIGTGASAIQFVPEIADAVGSLDIYQRTPPWIIHRDDRPISKMEKWLFKHVKPYQSLFRNWIYWQHELRVFGIVINPAFMKIFQKTAKRHLENQVKDEALRKRITPDYTIGCKRILVSNDWYPAIQKSGVSLIDAGIEKVTEKGIVDKQGNEREVDLIIYNTGFYATGNPAWKTVIGCNGLSLAERWKEGEEAYLSTHVPEFPNMLMMNGPNFALGHSSMIYMIEAQATHVLNCLKVIKQQSLKSLAVKDSVNREFNDDLQEKLNDTIWSTGCQSWYKNANGKITALWPEFTFTYKNKTKRFNADDFVMEVS